MEHTALSLEQQKVTTYGVIVARLLPDAIQSLRDVRDGPADTQAMILDHLGNRLVKDGRLSEADSQRLETSYKDSAALLPSHHPALDRLKSATTAMLDNSLEQRGTAFRQVQVEAGALPLGNSYDAAHFKQLHAHLTQDFLSPGETGKLRQHDRPEEMPVPGRPENRTYFLPSPQIEARLDEIGATIKAANNLRGLDKPSFAQQAARIYDDLNHIQPFSRANEAVLTTALTQLSREAGYAMDFAKVAPGELKKVADVALAREGSDSQQPLVSLMARITQPSPEPAAAMLRDSLGAAIKQGPSALEQQRLAERDVQQAGNTLAVHFIVETMVNGGLTQAQTRAAVQPEMHALGAVIKGDDAREYLPVLRAMADTVEKGNTPPVELIAKFRNGLNELEVGATTRGKEAIEAQTERSPLAVGRLLPDAINTLTSKNMDHEAAIVKGFGTMLAANGELSAEHGTMLSEAIAKGQRQLPNESIALDRLQAAVEPFLTQKTNTHDLARESVPGPSVRVIGVMERD